MNAAATCKRPQLGQLPVLLRTCSRQAHMAWPHSHLRSSKSKGQMPPPPRKSKTYVPPPPPKDHGEKIWVFAHRSTNQVVYSLKAQLEGFHALKTLPFNGKKTKPAKIRKDYWFLMALVNFPPGRGAVGRSVFHKLRELKHLHEVNWPDSFRYKTAQEVEDEKFRNMVKKDAKVVPMRNRKERGVALNAQKLNAIADMSIVLAGVGKGNRILAKALKEQEPKPLEVSVQWSQDYLKEHAKSWSGNVRHGLLGEPDPIEPEPKPASPFEGHRKDGAEEGTVLLA